MASELRTGGTSHALLLACGASQRARPTAPTVLAREMRRPALRPPRSAIVRLRSGAVASRSGAFRIAAFRCGGGGPRGWHGRAAVFGAPPLRHRESAFIREGQDAAATVRLAWSRCLPAPIASVPAASCPSRRRIRSGPVAGTPHPCALSAHVRFCGARSAPLRVSKVRALPLDRAEDLLDIRSVWLFPRMAQSWDTMQKCDLLLHDNAFMKCQSQTRRYPQRFCGAACTNATR